MLVVLSPAKSLELERNPIYSDVSNPVFIKEADYLAKKLGKLSAPKLGELMHLSENLAQLNNARYKDWNFSENDSNKRPAIYTFDGDVYNGFSAYELSEAQMQLAQEKVRILSGIYGLLKPLDLMQPYRLEMGTKWAVTPKTKNLYAYWGSKITEQLNKELKATESKFLINLASNEYFKVIKPRELAAQIINIVFKDEKNGKLKVVSFFAKKARGQMAKFIVTSNAKTLDDLKLFNEGGYGFQESLSSEEELVFTR